MYTLIHIFRGPQIDFTKTNKSLQRTINVPNNPIPPRLIPPEQISLILRRFPKYISHLIVKQPLKINT